ncbi:TPA: hypothetical protein ACNTQY_003834, partial [Escherichia coli]
YFCYSVNSAVNHEQDLLCGEIKLRPYRVIPKATAFLTFVKMIDDSFMARDACSVTAIAII